MTEPMLSDYALIGDSCAAALVSDKGSIDWCCLPEFDSPAIFSALLDRQKGGHFSISPLEEYKSVQKYIEDSNVVETLFSTLTGSVRLTDAFIALDDELRKRTLFADHEILRIVECISGDVKVRMEYSPKINYGEKSPQLRRDKNLGIDFSWKEHIIILRTTLSPEEITVSENVAEGVFTISRGEQLIFSLSYSNQSPAVMPELNFTAVSRMSDTVDYWRGWIQKCRYDGYCVEQVKRGALTLKLLAHAPSGAIIAAPTTSLPERLGGDLNWDYRYCWLRDASFTTRVLVKLGLEDEAHAYMNWILHATRLTQPELQVVYSVYGQANLKEKTLAWLKGYKNSAPVRIGNKAHDQFQLDVYGEVLDAIYTYSRIVDGFDHNSRRFMIGLGEVICKIWRRPDNGIWEIRSSGVHHTHSKVMAWVGLDRLVKLCDKYHWAEPSLGKFKETMNAIRNEIETRGYNSEIGTYTQELGGADLDASLLTLPLVGYCEYRAPRMFSTVQSIFANLSKKDLVYRNLSADNGNVAQEGTFVVCNFWLVENLAQSGRLEEAMRVFETTLSHAGASGLLSEEIDPCSRELLGNYPQGFSHIGLINAALSIDDCLKRKSQK